MILLKRGFHTGFAFSFPVHIIKPNSKVLYYQRALLSTSTTRTTTTTTTTCAKTNNPTKIQPIQRKDDDGNKDASFTSITKYLFPLLYKEGLKRNGSRLVTAFTLLIGSKLLTIQVPLLFKETIDTLSSFVAKETSLTTSMTTIPSTSNLIPFSMETLTMAVGGLLVAYASARIASSLSGEVKNYLFSSISLDLQRRIARESFRKLHSLPLSFHQGRDVGGLVRLVDRGIKGINFCSSSLLFNILPTALEIGMVCSLLSYKFGPSYALLSLLGIGAYTALTLSITKWRTQFRRKMNQADVEGSRLLHDTLTCEEVLKVFGGEEKETEEYDRILEKYNHSNKLTTSSLGLLNFGQQTILSVTLASIMFLSCQGISQGILSLGDIVLVNGLIFQLSLPLNFLGSIYRDIKQSITDMTGLLRLLTLSVNGDSGGGHLSNGLLAKPLKVTNGRIVIENITVKDGTHTLLDRLSLTTQKDRIAIVGKSGGGKSTIARSLLGLIKEEKNTDTTGGAVITSGTIKIDNQSVLQHTPIEDVCLVGQETLLLDRSLWDNLVYGLRTTTTDTTIREVEVLSVLDNLCLSDWKDRLGQRVGERGSLMSGGERQRIGIARALLRKPKIIVFDEATSQLDLRTERLVMEYLSSVKDCKMIFIAHRLSTIKDVEEIFVVEGGRLVEQGTHEDLLLRKNGSKIYKGLWSSKAGRH